MSIFKYKAKKATGESIEGKVEAASASIANTVLQNRGLFVINIKSFEENPLDSLANFLTGIKHKEIVTFTSQLSTMITAGLPLVTALNILEETSKESMSKLLESIMKQIEGGNSFHKALEEHPKQFNKVYTQLVKAGETGGVLDKVLDRLAQNLDKEKEFRGKVKGAMVYPIIVVCIMIVVMFIMMIFVVPKLTSMFAEFGAELPLPTKILIGVSDFFTKFWWLLIALIGGGGFFLKTWGKTEKGKKMIDRFILKIPIWGDLSTKLVLTEFTRTLSLLLTAGISLINGIDIVKDSMTNQLFLEAMRDTRDEIEKGISLSDSISKHEIFPAILYQMIAVGEETGKLDEVLMKVAVYFEKEAEQAVENLTAAMEPLIMVVLGVTVGGMVISIMLPIFNITQHM